MRRPRHWSASLTIAILTIASQRAGAQEQSTHAPLGVIASRRASPPLIDGRLTDECWQLATPARGLKQINPDEGQAATEETEIRVLFDDSAIYVAARMYDKDPALISRRLSKRDDDADADRISVY